jgi:3-hydroxy acid dehydrogenase / malonic semialdehyde reductase
VPYENPLVTSTYASLVPIVPRSQRTVVREGMVDQTILVTGASSGIGAAIVRRFARDGARVILAARRRDRMDSLLGEISGSHAVIPLDVRNRAEVERTLAGLAVDVLVNCAGLALGLEPAQEANLDDWEEMVDVNIKGLLHVTHAVLPGMVARDRGHVINLGSVAGSYPYPGGNVYGASKAFVKQFSLNLRADLLGKNIRVTDVEPGMVETEFSLVRYKGDAERASAVYRGIKVLSAADIADVVHYCASVPAHININRIELMPVMQAFSPFAVKRSTA